MKIWWKRLSQGDVIESEAAQFLKAHGDRAYEVAQKAARLIGKVTQDGWFAATVLPQLHVMIWGSRRGV